MSNNSCKFLMLMLELMLMFRLEVDIDVFVFQGERGIVLKPMVLKKYSHGGKPLSGSNKGGCKVL